jgi:hypothetical protein
VIVFQENREGVKLALKKRKSKVRPSPPVDIPHDLLAAVKIDATDFQITASRWLQKSFQPAERQNAFLKLAPSLTDAQFWQLFHTSWITFEKIDHIKLEEYLSKRRDSWVKSYLQAQDQTFYDSLPREITIYRGQDADDLVGLSWTTSRDVAISCAKGHSGILNARPFLIEAIVAKIDIAGAYTARNQSEIVIYDFANDVDVVSSDILTK